MRTFLTLNVPGIIAALLIGICIVVLGQNMGLFFVFVLFLFLLLGAVVTIMGRKRKKELKVYEGSRGWKNVVANGMVPALLALVYYMVRTYALMGSDVLVVAYVASVAGITADKFSSELGVLDGEPRSLLTMRKVKRGTSGAITAFGLLAGLLGAMIISLSLSLTSNGISMMVLVAIAGVFGNLVDSFFGYFETRGIGNKYTSNIMCAISAFAFCAAALLL